MDSAQNNAASQYAANTVDYIRNSHAFDDPAFFEMMEKWKGLFDRGLIWDYMSNRDKGGNHQESDTLMIYDERMVGCVYDLEDPGSPWAMYAVRLLPQDSRFQPSLLSGFAFGGSCSV